MFWMYDYENYRIVKKLSLGILVHMMRYFLNWDIFKCILTLTLIPWQFILNSMTKLIHGIALIIGSAQVYNIYNFIIMSSQKHGNVETCNAATCKTQNMKTNFRVVQQLGCPNCKVLLRSQSEPSPTLVQECSLYSLFFYNYVEVC